MRLKSVSLMSDPRPSPIFLADSRGLDFVNTLARPIDDEVEWLTSGEDLLTWLVQADLITKSVADRMRAAAVPGELDDVAAQARRLRAWFREFVLTHKGKPLDADALADLEPLNRILGRDEAYGQIGVRDTEPPTHKGVEADEATHPALAFAMHRRWRSPDTLLLPVAEAMSTLVCEDDFSLVKACEGHNCTVLFVDRSRKKARRWCSMAVCGNRAKLNAFRGRQKQAVA